MEIGTVLRWIIIIFIGTGIGALICGVWALGTLVGIWKRTFSSLQLTQWLAHKWRRQIDSGLVQDYRATFSTVSGQRVLQHWFDSVYCTVYHGHDSIEAVQHNARRSFVHEILENLDYAEHPQKYEGRREEP